MERKIVLTKEQKQYLSWYHGMPTEFLKSRLELVFYDDGSNWPWRLCNGSKCLGCYYSAKVVEELVAHSIISYSALVYTAKEGDKLFGRFYLDTGKGRVETAYVEFKGNPFSLLHNGDILEGTRHYLQKQEDGSFKRYVIVRS